MGFSSLGSEHQVSDNGVGDFSPAGQPGPTLGCESILKRGRGLPPAAQGLGPAQLLVPCDFGSQSPLCCCFPSTKYRDWPHSQLCSGPSVSIWMGRSMLAKTLHWWTSGSLLNIDGGFRVLPVFLLTWL